MKLNHYLNITQKKLNPNRLNTWTLRPKTIKLWEENIGGKFLDISLDNFSDLIAKAKATKAK